ncbi:MAG: hypothetical protein ACK4PR_05175, partial [Gammaproteobacteria bacterium]
MNSSLFQQKAGFASPLMNDPVFELDAADMMLVIKYAQESLEQFILPLSYDGSEPILRAIKQILLQFWYDMTSTPTEQAHAVITRDKPYQLLETTYFYYKRAQTNNMKIHVVLQNILIKQLAISEQEIQHSVDKQDKFTRFMLGKNHLSVVVKDDLIERHFWPVVGAEAHVMLCLLEAKAIMQRRGLGIWHKQLIGADNQSYQQEMDEMMLQVTQIRQNKSLNPAQRKQRLLTLIHQHLSQDIMATASNLDRLLVDAERHVNDY